MAFLSTIAFVTSIEAASPSYQPAPLRNQALMFETSGSGIQKIKLDAPLKKRTSAKNNYLAKLFTEINFGK